MSKLIRRCSICKAIEVDSEVLSSRDYWPDFFIRLGYSFSDTTALSRQCLNNLYGGLENIKDRDEKEIMIDESQRLRYNSCD